MKKIHLRIVTPEKTAVDAQVDMVGAMGSEGAFSVLPGHIDFLTYLKDDGLWYRQDGQVRELAVSGGLIEVGPEHVRVLADSVEYIEDIDPERAERALKRAQELISEAKASGQSGQEVDKAAVSQITASLGRAAVRLKLASHKTTTKRG